MYCSSTNGLVQPAWDPCTTKRRSAIGASLYVGPKLAGQPTDLPTGIIATVVACVIALLVVAIFVLVTTIIQLYLRPVSDCPTWVVSTHRASCIWVAYTSVHMHVHALRCFSQKFNLAVLCTSNYCRCYTPRQHYTTLSDMNKENCSTLVSCAGDQQRCQAV